MSFAARPPWVGSQKFWAASRINRSGDTALANPYILGLFRTTFGASPGRFAGRITRLLGSQATDSSVTASGHTGGWSHSHAISTSSDPASAQRCPQYFSPAGTRQRHGMWAQVLSSVFGISSPIIFRTFFISGTFSSLQKPIRSLLLTLPESLARPPPPGAPQFLPLLLSWWPAPVAERVEPLRRSTPWSLPGSPLRKFVW